MISKTHYLEICLDQITFVDKTTNFNIKRYCINYSALYIVGLGLFSFLTVSKFPGHRYISTTVKLLCNLG